MGTGVAGTVAVRRPKWRAYLLLSRLSNLPTVWTNVLAGAIAAHGGVPGRAVGHVTVAASLLYTAGMFLNDAFDRRFDAAHRSDRPIPAGDVSPAEVFGAGIALLALGNLWLALTSPRTTLAWGLALSAAILYYDWRHKRDPLGPLAMGVCRGLVYCVAGAAVSGAMASAVLAGAAVVTVYVLGLTFVARFAGPGAGRFIPVLIAGISLVDAAIVVVNGGGALGFAAAAAFPLTLVLQRVVPGT